MTLLFKNGYSNIFFRPEYLTQRPPLGGLNDLKMRAQKIFIHIPDLEKDGKVQTVSNLFFH